MSALTEIIRVPIVDAGSLTLEQRIENACDVHFAAGLNLAAALTVGADIILIFQTK
jgi:hypothetical protein